MNTKAARRVAVNLLIALTFVFAQACGSYSDQSQTESSAENTGEISAADAEQEAEQATADFREERAEVVVDLEQQQDELEQEMDQLKNRINHQGNKTDAALKRQLAELEIEQRDLKKDIDIAKNATEDAWQDIKAGFKKAGRTLINSFEEAGDQLKNR